MKKKLLILISIIASAFLCACSDATGNKEETSTDDSITRVVVFTSRTWYWVGEELNATDLQAYAYYSEEIVPIPISDCEFRKGETKVSLGYTFTSDDVGKCEIEVWYKNVSTSISFLIYEEGNVPIYGENGYQNGSITILQYMDKITYMEGEAFDSAGLKLQYTDADGNTATLDRGDFKLLLDGMELEDGYVFTESDAEKGDEYNANYIGVKYDGNVWEYITVIFINKFSPTEIWIESEPLKTTYKAGDHFDETGLVVMYKDKNGNTVEAARSEYILTYDSENVTEDFTFRISDERRGYKLELYVWKSDKSDYFGRVSITVLESDVYEHINSEASDFTYTLDSSGNATITGLVDGKDNPVTDITIPATINGHKVTTIAAKAFEDYDNIRSIAIEEGVTTLGSEEQRDFGGNLQGAFYGLRFLKKLSLPSSIELYFDCLGGIWSEFELTLAEGITKIPYNAFHAWGLPKVHLPSTLKTISQDAFHNSRKFTEIEFPEGLEYIELGAFYGSGLTEVEIPDGCTLFGTPFESCESLKKITLGAVDVPEFYGTNAMICYDCQALETVVIKNYTTAWTTGQGDENQFHYNISKRETEPASGWFSKCENVKNVVILDGVDHASLNFRSNHFIENLEIANSVKKLAIALAGNTVIEELDFNGLDELVLYCSDMTALKKVKLTNIKKLTCDFSNCALLESADLSGTTVASKNFTGCKVNP